MTPHRCNRPELLRLLETVQPGLSAKETLQQSSCFVFRNGWVATFNEEVCARAKTGLPAEVHGAVKAEPLLKLLRQIPHDEVLVFVDEARFCVRVEGKRTEAWVRLEADILLPISEVEKPESWQPLAEEFEEAVTIVKESAGKDDEQFLTVCIHVHPEYLEACDRYQATRYRLATGVPEPFLVREKSLRHVVALGLTRMGVTETWLHFRNDAGLVLSCRRYVEDYPDMAPLLDFRGEPASLPPGLVAAARLGEIFSSEDKDNNRVTVTLREGAMVVEGTGTSGGVKKGLKLKYHGEPTSFQVSPVLLASLGEKGQDCEIGTNKLRIDGGRWVYVTCLSPVQEKKTKNPEPAAAGEG